tara:strand:+ start:195 stop:482 length:288 start_codon:yes stop_codon:yes gene_type:complete
MKKKYLISIERLHLIAGFSLIVSGILVYFTDGFEMALSWSIFGAMYISMSDVGEDEMSEEKLKRPNHIIRRLFGYAGAGLGIILTAYYVRELLSS